MAGLCVAFRSSRRAGALGRGIGRCGKAYALAPWNVIAAGLHAGLLALSGNQAAAEQAIATLGDGTAFGAPCGFATYQAVRSELDLAADWYEKAIEQRDTRTPWIVAHLLPGRLTSHYRWPSLRGMMNLPGTALRRGEVESFLAFDS